MDLAGILHRRRHGERLAAATGAIVKHLFARLCAGQQRGQLRALVLDLEEALGEGHLGGGRDLPAWAVGCGNADPLWREPGFVRAGRLQAAQHLRAVGPERVDAQIERRAAGQRLRLGKPGVPESLFEMRNGPFGNVALHPERG